MPTGTLKMWNAERGYGFIGDDSGGPDSQQRSPAGLKGQETMTLLTAAECREIADRKMVEAEGDPVHGKEFRATAEAWLFLAEKIEQAETIEALKAKGK